MNISNFLTMLKCFFILVLMISTVFIISTFEQSFKTDFYSYTVTSIKFVQN